jgi:predicted DNA-binding transcriptional regulator YafY
MAGTTDVPKGERMVRMYALLVRNKSKKFTVADIVSYLGQTDSVSLRNVQRDLKDLAEVRGTSVICETIEGRKFYYIEPDMRGKLSLPIQKNGLLAFFLLKRLQPFFAPKAKTLEELSEAVIDHVSESDYDLFEDLDEKLEESSYLFDGQSPLAIDGSLWNDTLTSLVKRRKLKILYQAADKEKPSEKIICPAKLILFKGELYFICMSEYKEDWDFYVKLCRIEKAELLKETFIPDPKRIKRIEKRLTESFGIMDKNEPSPKKVVVRFPAGPYYRRIFAEKQFHSSQKVTVDKKGNTLVTMHVPIGLDLINWVLEWPESVVLEPKELIKEMLVVAKTLMGKYGK